jgi:thiol:disulfide interchange protein
MNAILLLVRGDANSPINKWLNENPLVLGLLALMIGIALAGSGIYELRNGVSRDKRGNEIKGNLGKFTSILRIAIGTAACVFGVHKAISG